jgi:hypothetical protein
VLTTARQLPAKAVQLPVNAVGTALSGLEAARREYGELAERGEQLIARLRGASFEELEHAVDSVLGTSTENAKEAVAAAGDRAQDRAEADRAVQQTLPVEEAPPVVAKESTKAQAPETTHEAEAPAPTSGRVDSAATPDVVEQVEKIAHNVDAPLVTDAAELPLPDNDHMTLGALRGRLRSLDMQQLVQIRDYEKSKAHRLPVITMLDNRIAKLANGESVPSGAAPEAAEAATATKPPKNVSTTAAATNPPTPPHTKVRVT